MGPLPVPQQRTVVIIWTVTRWVMGGGRIHTTVGSIGIATMARENTYCVKMIGFSTLRIPAVTIQSTWTVMAVLSVGTVTRGAWISPHRNLTADIPSPPPTRLA